MLLISGAGGGQQKVQCIPRAGVTGICEVTDMSTGNQMWSFEKAGLTLNNSSPIRQLIRSQLTVCSCLRSCEAPGTRRQPSGDFTLFPPRHPDLLSPR